MKIILEYPIYDDANIRETDATSGSNYHPCGMDIHLSHIQSRKLKLVPFASLLAISGTFNSLSKVLFIFPSRYLFAIGLKSIFSFRGKLPPILHTISKVRDSTTPSRMPSLSTWTGLSPSMTLFSNENYAEAQASIGSQGYNSETRFLIYILSFAGFSRPY